MGTNKTISLDDDTAKIADRLPNFSRFVRQCLMKYASNATIGEEYDNDDAHIAPPPARIWGVSKSKCNPNHKKGRCQTCWGNL